MKLINNWRPRRFKRRKLSRIIRQNSTSKELNRFRYNRDSWPPRNKSTITCSRWIANLPRKTNNGEWIENRVSEETYKRRLLRMR